MRTRCLAVALLLGLFIPAAAHAGTVRPLPRVGLILHDNVTVREHADPHAPVTAVLVQQTQVEVLGYHATWAHILIWGSVRGWVSRREVVFRKPWVTVSHYHAPTVHYHVHAYPPRRLVARATATATVLLSSRAGGPTVATVPAGTHLKIDAWEQDSSGRIWYRTAGRWALGDSLTLALPRPGNPASAAALVKRVSGKGMWLTLGIIAGSSPDALARAAQRDGITHLYLESAISPLGFHGKNTVGHLVDAAHAHHISVIAWVYPYLYDVASDVALTAEVAAFRSPDGEAFDGIAEDLENNVHLWTVRDYSQLVRLELGGNALLVGVTYPPQSLATYPFAAVGAACNVIAPMDYWHQTQTPYGLDYNHMAYGRAYSFRYAVDSVARIRAAAGPVPIAPIGQTFDNFGRMEMGPSAPSADEVQGFLDGARSARAVGVSFFEWTSATDAEWQVIRHFRY